MRGLFRKEDRPRVSRWKGCGGVGLPSAVGTDLRSRYLALAINTCSVETGPIASSLSLDLEPS
jgi:hypothetical protein